MSPSFSWSDYQHSIFDFVANGSGHGLITARAGAAKTSTIVEAVKRLARAKGMRVLYLAFAAHDSAALKARLPKSISVMTTHVFGLTRLRQKDAFGWPLVADEGSRVMRRWIADELDGMAAGAQVEMSELLALAKAWMVDPRDLDALTEFARENQCSGHEYASIETWITATSALMLRAFTPGSLDRTNARGEIEAVRCVTFDDMVWLPSAMKLSFTKPYDLVLVDETQDLTRAQHQLVLSAAGPSGRILAVGDDRQCIYSFRAADTGSMERLRTLLTPSDFSLPICYRCPKSVVELAQQYVPDIEPRPDAPAGTVSHGHSQTELVALAQPKQFVISRTNAALVRVALALARAGKRCVIRGRDIGGGLKSLLRQSGESTVSRFLPWLAAWTEKQLDELRKAMGDGIASVRSAARRQREIEDRVATLRTLCDGLNDLSQVAARVDRLFAEPDAAADEDRVILLSTHKAKGLEAHTVWLLDTTYKPDESQEEANLYYVAITRALDTLRIVATDYNR